MAFNVGNSVPVSGGDIHSNSSTTSVTAEKVADSRNVEELQTTTQEESVKSNLTSDNEKKAQLKDWINKMNKVVKENVKFNFSEELGSIYVTVVDSNTHEVIRTIPNEDALQLSAIWKDAVGNIFDKKG